MKEKEMLFAPYFCNFSVIRLMLKVFGRFAKL